MNELFLPGIKEPGDLKKYTDAQLEQLCAEIRTVMVDTVAKNGGHLSSNLGVVELTVALLRELTFPQDQIVWDVGHQCYAYKLLTGRYDRFSTLRQENGISGFPRIHESPYDIFSTGHSSTSIASAFGLVQAKILQKQPGTVFAVIGDGALSGGLAYEGLNNAGRYHNGRLVVILNDNKRSISRNVGAMARSLAVMRTRKGYRHIKSHIEQGLMHIPLVGKPLRDGISTVKKMLKNAIYPSNLFEELGFQYIGPIDGHDLPLLRESIRAAQEETRRPVLIHVCTVKGKGYSFAEANPGAFHGLSKFDVKTGEAISSGTNFSAEFGKKLVELAQTDETLCAITASMKYGTGLQDFAHRYPDRFFDVGIAEEYAVTFAAGLSGNGMKPVFAVYSTFLQRAYDQLLHDAALQGRKLVLGIDRAGFTGDDGETHQGLFDCAFLRTVPNVTLYAPTYYDELTQMLEYALYRDPGVVGIRYPRGKEPTDAEALPLSRGKEPFDLLKNAGSVLLISFGRCFASCVQAKKRLAEKGITADILKLNRILPIPEEAVSAAGDYSAIVFVEEGVRCGGIGEGFRMMLNAVGYEGKFRLSAVENGFVEQASAERQAELCGLSPEQIAEAAEALCRKE